MTVADATTVLGVVVGAAIRAAALAMIVAIGLAAFRVKSPAARQLAWSLVLTAALAMPLLSGAVPTLRWPLPTAVTQWIDVSVVASASGLGAPAPTTFVADRSDPTRSREIAVAIAAAAPWFLLLYALGAMLLIVRAGAAWRITWRLERRAVAIQDAPARALLASLAAQAGLTRVPRLVQSKMLRVAATTSVWRPVIVLPRRWRTWNSERLAAVLAHEVAHVVRRDTLGQRASLLYRAFTWFSPLGWWLHRHLAELAEHASDDAALAAGADRTAYAETLLASFADLRGQRTTAGWYVAMARGGAAAAERRLDRILSWKGGSSMKVTARFAFAAVLVVAAASVGVASVAPVSNLGTRPVVDVVSSETPREVDAPQDDEFGKGAYPENTPGLVKPKVVLHPAPHYSSAAMRARISGNVTLDAVILADGTVGDVRVSKLVPPALADAFGQPAIADGPAKDLVDNALAAARRWSFTPATLNDLPVPTVVSLMLEFRLH